MDHAMLDLTEIPGAAEGDEIVLLGAQGTDLVAAEEMAAWCDTIPYEILARLGPRLRRIEAGG